MTVRHAGLLRVGFRRLGEAGSSGLPYVSPLTPNAVVFIDPTGTKATTATTLLYEDPGSGSKTLAVLEAGTALLAADDAFLVVKKVSGRPSAIFDGGGFSANIIQLKNGGGGTRDQVQSTNVGGLQIGTNAGGGLTNTGITLDPGSAGNAFFTLDTDQMQINCSKFGVFSTTPALQYARTTAGPAGATYTATTRAMIDDCFNALRRFGFLSP